MPPQGILWSIIFISTGVVIIPLTIGIYNFCKAHTDKENFSIDEQIFDKIYEIFIYEYDAQTQSVDDIYAKRMNVYRSTGKILNLDDEEPIFQHTINLHQENLKELTAIVRSALEVKRINETDIYYFFTNIKDLKLQSPRLRGIYFCIYNCISKNRNVLLKMSAQPDVITKPDRS